MDTEARSPQLDAILGAPPITWGDLTDRFIAIIDANPLRLRMNGYLFTLSPGEEFGEHAGRPDCGTVGCYIGWGALQLGILNHQMSDLLSKRCIDILEPEDARARRFAQPLWDSCYYMPRQMSGTREYADLVLARFRAVREEYRAEMDATTLAL